MRVLVTGSRDFTDQTMVRDVLDALLAEHGHPDLLAHGGLRPVRKGPHPSPDQARSPGYSPAHGSGEVEDQP